MEDAIITSHLTRKFGDFVAVDDLNLEVKRGLICGFLGPNGAGKTTAIRMLCGILAPSSGEARVLGYDLYKDVEKIKNSLGYMSQRFSLYDDLTVEENLSFYAGLYNIPARQRQIRMQEMLSMANLEQRKNHLVNTLSRGFKQRLALGCAIISDPSILFLDEPTSGVSPGSRRAFFGVIQELANLGKTVIVTTHFMDEAERCDQIAFFNQGRLLALDSPDHLKANTIAGTMVEILVPDPVPTLAALNRLPYIRESSLHGVYLHAVLEGIEGIQQLESDTGVNARVITPTLEDVFVTLAKRRERRNPV